MAEADNVSLSLTEDRLSTDTDGQYRQELIDSLNAEAAQLKSSKQGGLSPEEFEQTDALIKALDDAVKVIELTWLKYHKTSGTH